MKYRRPADRKEDRLAFGVWPAVSLADARIKRDEAKRLLAKAIDLKAEQKGAQAEAEGAFSFEAIARQWHSGCLKRWTAPHAQAVLRSMEHYVFPHIGNNDIRKLKTRQLLAAVNSADTADKHDVACASNNVLPLLCDMPYRTVSLTATPRWIWLWLWDQLK